MAWIKTVTIPLLILSAAICRGQEKPIERQLMNLTKDFKAKIGVAAVDFTSGEIVQINGQQHFPMQSVYKFHLALYVLHKVDINELSIDQDIFIKKAQLLPQTWSPLRDSIPEGSCFVPLSTILRFTVANSDNNGCDILFDLIGGPKRCNDFIHAYSKDCSIAKTEEEMHRNEQAQFQNWTTPTGAVALLKLFNEGKILQPKTKEYLHMLMESSTTGASRIKARLPKGAKVANKTGSSGRNSKGIAAATNDIAIITRPNGQRLAIAVFVSDSQEDDTANDRIIAEISKLLYDYFGVDE